ncbi:MAG: hypothetical protein EAZ07_04685 [Cytophagales bacterium]|nr:MAG: hypothetical protein EAZ07_04685 [Cytophagales bacterium]
MGSTCTCHDRKKTPCPVIYMEQDLKDYCVFQLGTWWVYEEEQTKAKDCVYVFSSTIDIYDCDKSSNGSENSSMKLKSTFLDTVFLRGGGGIFFSSIL